MPKTTATGDGYGGTMNATRNSNSDDDDGDIVRAGDDSSGYSDEDGDDEFAREDHKIIKTDEPK